MAETPENEHGESRKVPRKRALLTARIAYGDGAFSSEATIKNISEAGAKLVVPKGQPIPEELFMIDVKAGIAYEAKTVWRHPPEVGLSFTAAHPLDETLPSNLKFLLSAYNSARPRAEGREWSSRHRPSDWDE